MSPAWRHMNITLEDAKLIVAVLEDGLDCGQKEYKHIMHIVSCLRTSFKLEPYSEEFLEAPC